MLFASIALSIVLFAPVVNGIGAVVTADGLPAASANANARVHTSLVERSFVSGGTAAGYEDQLVRFIVHLYDNEDSFLTDGARNQMAMYDNSDASNFRRQPTRGGNKRPQLRAYVRRTIKAIQPARDGLPHNSPIKIDGDGALTYTVIRDYMASKYNTVEVDKDSAVKYLRESDNADQITDEMQTGPSRKVTLQVYQSNSQFSAIRSAIGYVYKSARVPMPEDMASEISIFINGMKRTVTAAKETLGLKIGEGKDALKFEGYDYTAKKLFFSRDKRDIFNHLFLVLDWNLMKRAENCVHAKINHVRFQDDCLVFEFAKSKGQQLGDLHGPWHVYANPECPWLCPVLALARYLFCYPDVLRGDVPLFEGTNQYARYSSRMLILYKESAEDLKAMGIDYKDLGSHSARKGVGTMVAAGCTVGPPIVPLCLRAGWALGGVKDKYLFRENAGDQYVGRCATGLPVTEKEFAVSPPYFDYSDLELADRLEMKKKIDQHLSTRIPHYSEIKANALNLLHYCFASICYSYEYLNENLHDECPLRNAAVFKDIPEDIIKLAVIKYPWNKTKDTPRFTGIPPHVNSLAKLEEMEMTMKAIPTRFMDMMKSEMDRRKFFASEVNTHEITDAIKTMSEKIVAELLEKTGGLRIAVSENSTTTATTSTQLDRRRNGLVIENEDDDGDWCNRQLTVTEDGGEDDGITTVNRRAEEAQLARERVRQSSAQSVKKRQLLVGVHHGKLNPLPKAYTFSAMTSLQLIQNWFIGDLRRNIPPLCRLDSKNVAFLTRGNNIRNKMVAFMRIVEQEAKEKDVWIERLGDWNHESVTRMWNAISGDFSAKYCKTKRKKELCWSTVYTKMTEANAFKNKKNKLYTVAS